MLDRRRLNFAKGLRSAMMLANLENALPRFQRPMILIAMIVALSAAVLLSACGRKGPLDPPPGARALQQQSNTASPNQDSILFPEYDEQGRPIAPPGQKRRIPLDVLID
jgi:predicted small lipoprotein YifL